MSKILPVFVFLAVLIIFPVFIFYLLVRAIRGQVRWWGIVILLAILTCYCTTMVGVAGLLAGGNATASAALEERYCREFREALAQTETLPEATARMDAVSASDEYRIPEPDKNLRFRFVWLLGGCFLFAGANLMMFGPGRHEHRHPADCVVMTVAALVVFLTGIWQIAWGNGYAYQAMAYRGRLTGWHSGIRLDEIRETNGQIDAGLGAGVMSGDSASPRQIRTLNELEWLFRELSGEKNRTVFRFPGIKKDDAAGAFPQEDESAGNASDTDHGAALPDAGIE